MDKADIIPGVVYAHRSGKPVRLITNRIYGLKVVKDKPVYELAPRVITAARRDPRTTGNRVDYGYLVLSPQPVVANSATKLKEIAVHDLLDSDELPLLHKVPKGFQIELVTALSSLRGEWAVIQEKDRAEAEARQAAETVARDGYNELARQLNKYLGERPVRILDRVYDPVPEAFELTPGQVRLLLDAYK